MAFLKRWWSYLVGALITIGALMAANRATKAKQKAQYSQDMAEVERVNHHTNEAKRHLENAKVADEQAKAAKLEARDKIDRLGELNEDAAEVLDRWKRSNRMRNRG